MAKKGVSLQKLLDGLDLKLHSNQLKVLRGRKKFTTITAGRRWGKTILASFLALAYLNTRNKTIWIVAPTYDLAKRTWRYIYGWCLRCFSEFKINQATLSIENEKANTMLELKTAENPSNCIGAGVDFMIVDEASRIKSNVWHEALYPTLADKQGSAFLISTPKGKNWFHDIYVKGDEGYEDYASFTYQTKDNLAVPHLKEEQKRAKRDLPDHAYRQEYLAEFIEDGGQVFRNIKQCIKGKEEEYNREHHYVIGIDLAKYEDYTCVSVLDLTSFHLVRFERFNHMDWEYQIKVIKGIIDDYKKAPVVIDATGVGDPIAESLQRDGYAVEMFKYTNEKKKYLIENLALKIQRKEITFPDIKELVNELETFEYEISEKTRKITYNAPAGYHDDCINSLALAVYKAGHYKREKDKYKEPYPEGSLGALEEEIEQEELEKDLTLFI